MNSARKRVLWVDDDGPEIFLYEEHVLSDHGWSVDWSTSVMAAASALSQQRYRLVICDMCIPLRSGADAEPAALYRPGAVHLVDWVHAGRDGGTLADSWMRTLEPPRYSEELPIAVVSGFMDAATERTIRSVVGSALYLGWHVKPLSEIDLCKLLARAESAERM